MVKKYILFDILDQRNRSRHIKLHSSIVRFNILAQSWLWFLVFNDIIHFDCLDYNSLSRFCHINWFENFFFVQSQNKIHHSKEREKLNPMMKFSRRGTLKSPAEIFQKRFVQSDSREFLFFFFSLRFRCTCENVQVRRRSYMTYMSHIEKKKKNPSFFWRNQLINELIKNYDDNHW